MNERYRSKLISVKESRVMLSCEQFARLLSNIAKFTKSTEYKVEKISKKVFEFTDNIAVTLIDDNDVYIKKDA